jgi:hypothetical protein
MTSVLDGLWVYTLQGFMHGLKYDKSKPEMSRELAVGRGAGPGGVPRKLGVVNLAGGNLAGVNPPAVNPLGGAPPLAQPAQPAPGTLYALPAMPTFQPPGTADNTGFYPVSEIGHMTFADDKVEGELRLNPAGYANATNQLAFYGMFTLDQPKPQPPGIRMGIISIISDAVPNLFWDYSFIMVSRTEIQLAAGGRVPRPATMTGTMKKIDPSEFESWADSFLGVFRL